jgi:EAL domain-containing protein (putative c-di-GMP-specific phosphodiesterase class I)
MNRPALFIMDDNPESAAMLAELGTSLNCVVACSTRPEDLEQFAAQAGRLLIVLDLMMPEFDGIQALRLLAKKESRAAILLISGTDPKILDSAKRLGSALGLSVVGSMHKPLSLPGLEEVICRTLHVHPAITPEDIERALECAELSAYVQPIVGAGDGSLCRVVGGEVLCRWTHNDHVVMPGDFIPEFERANRISDLTWRIVDQTIGLLARMRREGFPYPLSINVSAQTLEALDWPDQIEDRVRSAGQAPEDLTIEVTESTALAEFGRAGDVLSRLRLKGFDLSIDDMGTGYSSLTHLIQFPFNELKIDQTFVAELGQSRDAETMVRLTTLMAHELGMTACAEGVENSDTLGYLEKYGIDRYQGYLVSPALPPDEWLAFIREDRRAGGIRDG